MTEREIMSHMTYVCTHCPDHPVFHTLSEYDEHFVREHTDRLIDTGYED
jgi:hypothetical protein